MTERRPDLTRPADLHQLQFSGPLRTQRPRYLDRLPPCNDACPAGENIQAWLDKAQAGEFEAAWRILVQNNPMPSVHGRVCYHPCESACNRGQVDEPVAIHSVERFLGDLALAAEAGNLPPNYVPTADKTGLGDLDNTPASGSAAASASNAACRAAEPSVSSVRSREASAASTPAPARSLPGHGRATSTSIATWWARSAPPT